MKWNYVVAFGLTLAVLVGWEYFFVRPQKLAEARSSSSAPMSAPSVETAVPVRPPIARESVRIYEIGDNRLTVNRYGGAISQWEIREDGQWLTLVPKKEFPLQPLATFPDLSFETQQSGNTLTFKATREDGLRVEKSIQFAPSGHLHEFRLRITNSGRTDLPVDDSIGWGPGVEAGDEAGQKGRASKGTQRALVFENDNVHRVKAGTLSGTFRWWAVDGHYFLSAFIPSTNGGATAALQVEKFDDYFSVRQSLRALLKPGETLEQSYAFYLGPKGYEDLKKLGFGLERSVDFGMFAPLARLIHKTLLTFHGATKNFGWAIILLTVIMQIIVLPLTITSFRHGQKMKTVQPQMKRLQELYKNDPRRLNVEMMELYKRHGLRFMGLEGCLPVLIQMPVFFSLYAALRSTFELRHAPWLGWVKDLSHHDPLYILPVLMGAGMFFQQKMSATSLDPSQRQIMYIMPVMFTFFFLKMPSGLVIYWLTSSVLSILVQTILLRRHAAQEARS